MGNSVVIRQATIVNEDKIFVGDVMVEGGVITKVMQTYPPLPPPFQGGENDLRYNDNPSLGGITPLAPPLKRGGLR